MNTKEEPLLWVELFEAKPNKMFSEAQRQTVRFLRYSAAVACAECGKRSKHCWTAVYSFKALSLATLVPIESDKVHRPLTPVCRNHLLKAVPLPARSRKKNNG